MCSETKKPVSANCWSLAMVFTYFFLLLFSPFFFSYAFCFSHTSGNLPCVKICFPQYFGITRRYIQKKIFFWGKFYFFKRKKNRFFGRFFSAFYGQRSVTAAWATRSPWSILKQIYQLAEIYQNMF